MRRWKEIVERAEKLSKPDRGRNMVAITDPNNSKDSVTISFYKDYVSVMRDSGKVYVIHDVIYPRLFDKDGNLSPSTEAKLKNFRPDFVMRALFPEDY